MNWIRRNWGTLVLLGAIILVLLGWWMSHKNRQRELGSYIEQHCVVLLPANNGEGEAWSGDENGLHEIARLRCKEN
jgi:hypothetical protein